jgi:hypothetical protein
MKDPNIDAYVYDGLMIPTSEEYYNSNTTAPPINSSNFSRAQEKGLGTAVDESELTYDLEHPYVDRRIYTTGSYSENYMETQAYYRKALEYYLLETLRLDIYEDEMEASGLDFWPASEDSMAFSKKYSNLNLIHLYLFNNLYIEQMSSEDIALLEDLYQTNGTVITPEALELVKRTHPEVIQILDSDGNAYPDNTYPLITPSGVSVDPRSLIIAFNDPFHYDENGSRILTNQQERSDYLLERLPKIRAEIAQKVGVPVTLFVMERGIVQVFEDED